MDGLVRRYPCRPSALQPTKPQIDIYAQLDLPLPGKIIEITPAVR